MLIPGHKNQQFIHSLQTLTTFASSISKHRIYNVVTLFPILLAFFALLVATTLPAFTSLVLAQSPSSVGASCNNNPSLVLPINEQWTQEEYPWCWATTAAVVMDYHKKMHKPKPCDVVSAIITEDDPSRDGVNCCLAEQKNSFESGCARTGTVAQSLQHYKFHFKYLKNPNLADALLFNRVSEELCSNGPFIARLKSSSGIRHAYVVHGYTIDPSAGPQIHIRDPQNDFSDVIPYDVFVKPPSGSHMGEFVVICDTEKANCPP